MNPSDRLEIYVPVEAEVKSIPLWSLSDSVLRGMGLSLPDSERSRQLTDSPVAIWICPVVIRRKEQVSHAGNSEAENMSSVLNEFQATSRPLHMSFVSSNFVAYNVLKDVRPEQQVSANKSHTSMLAHTTAPDLCQYAIVIYSGSIYLSIMKQSQNQRGHKTCDPQLAAQSSVPSTSSSKTQKKELLNDSSPKKKRTTCEVAENKQDVSHRVRDAPQSTDGVHKVNRHCHEGAGGEQAAEEAAAWFQSGVGPEVVTNRDGGECEMMEKMGGEEVESTSQNGNNWMESSMQIDPRSEPVAAACAPTSLLKDIEYKELAHEEEIARLKARLKQNKAALRHLHISQ